MMRILATMAWTLAVASGCGLACCGLVTSALADETAQSQPATQSQTPPATESNEQAKADEHAKSDERAKSDEYVKGKAEGTHAATPERPPVLSAGAESHSAEQASGEHKAEPGHEAAAGHDALGHHDPHDLSHGNASAGLKAAQELRFDLALATLIVFLLLAAILAKFAWSPIVAGLDKREQTIARQIADAERASALAAKQLQEYERKLAAATEEARAIVGQARQDALAAKDKIVADAQAAAAKERDRAVADITSAKNLALQEIAEKSVSTAISLASNIIRREVKPEDHDKLIHESLQKFSSLN